MNSVWLTAALLASCMSLTAGEERSDDRLADQGVQQIRAMEAAFQRAIRRARPSVVSVFLLDADEVAGRGGARLYQRGLGSVDPDSQTFAPVGAGSGIVVGADGLILTAYHIAIEAAPPDNRRPKEILVRTSDGQKYPARIHAADPRSDLAVIKLVSSKPLDLKPIAIADGSILKPGQFVLALGNPFGTAAPDGVSSASWGIISNVRRRATPVLQDETSLHHQRMLIQTDARLNTGISGGALIDVEGRLTGITMALTASVGYEAPGGFAVPTDELTQRIIQTLADGREMEYGYIGISVKTVMDDDRMKNNYPPGLEGVLVDMVFEFLPAHTEGGLKSGDIVTRINGHKIRTQGDLMLLVGSRPVGEVLAMDVVRGSQESTLHVPLTKYPVKGKIVATKKRPLWEGLRVDYLSILTNSRDRMYTGRLPSRGVVVRDVQDGSQAYKKEISPSWVITDVNGKPVRSPDEFEAAVASAKYPVRLSVFSMSPDGRDAPKEIVFETPGDAKLVP